MKDSLWNEEIIKNVTGAEIHGKFSGNAICIDSRKATPNCIFVAFKGEKVDGHEYIAEAFAKGASAAIVEHIPSNLSIDRTKLAVVKNSEKAIEDLANFNRNTCQAKIIAVTGSVGKTSTKEALATAFKALGKTHCSEGNYNNKLGLAISLASMPKDTEFAIYELGMDHAGEIEVLTKTVKPDAAIITTIAPVHLENFNSVEGIARAKAEIFLGMKSDSYVVLNGDNEYYQLLKDLAEKQNIKNITSFGENSENNSFLISYKREGSVSHISASIIGQKLDYKIAAYGKHQAINTVAVLAIIKSMSLDFKKAAESLKEFNNVKGRGKISFITFDNKKILVIDDSYNASPKSVNAALSSIKDICAGSSIKRRVAILADMYELGDDSIAMHKALLPAIEQSGIDKVITVGELMKNLFDILPNNIKLAHFNDFRSAINHIYSYVDDNDCILVKGSFGTKIHELANYLLEEKK